MRGCWIWLLPGLYCFLIPAFYRYGWTEIRKSWSAPSGADPGMWGCSIFWLLALISFPLSWPMDCFIPKFSDKWQARAIETWVLFWTVVDTVLLFLIDRNPLIFLL